MPRVTVTNIHDIAPRNREAWKKLEFFFFLIKRVGVSCACITLSSEVTRTRHAYRMTSYFLVEQIPLIFIIYIYPATLYSI